MTTGNHFYIILNREQAKRVFGQRDPHELLALVTDLCREELAANRGLRLASGHAALDVQLAQLDASLARLASGRPLDAGPSATIHLIRPDLVPQLAAELQPPQDRAEVDAEDTASGDAAPLLELMHRAAAERGAILYARLPD